MANGYNHLNYEQIKEQIRSRLDIISIVSEYVNLKSSGNNFFGLCPFHQEKTPSFSVNSRKGIFKCFGCGTGGDVFSFIMKIENLEFKQAINFLAKKANIDTTALTKNANYDEIREHDAIINLNHRLVKIFHYILINKNEGKPTIEYLLNRNISQNTINEYMLGYSPKEYGKLQQILENRQYSADFLVKAGLFIKKNNSIYPRFFNRLMIPIFNEQNECVGFGGRTMSEQGAKYLNSPESLIFKKRNILYGLHIAKKQITAENLVFLVEGYFDVIMAHQNGLKNTVAPLGTSVTPNQLRLLQRYCKKIALLFDSDQAGLKAVHRTLFLLANSSMEQKIVLLPENMDPADYFTEHTLEEFWQYYQASALTPIQFLIFYLKKEFDLTNAYQKIHFLESIFSYLKTIDNPILKETFLQELSHELNMSISLIQSELSKSADKVKKRKQTQPQKDNNELPANLKQELEFLIIISMHKDLFYELISPNIDIDDFDNDISKNIFKQIEILMQTQEKVEIPSLLISNNPENISNFIVDRAINEALNIETEQQILDRLVNLKTRNLKKKDMLLLDEIKQIGPKGEIKQVKYLEEERMAIKNEIRKFLSLQGAS